MIREEFAIIYLSSLFPPINLPLSVWGGAQKAYISSLAANWPFPDSPRGQRAASPGGGEGAASCPGSHAQSPGLLRRFYESPVGRTSDSGPRRFSGPEGLWGRRGFLCLPALMGAEVTTSRIQMTERTDTRDRSFLCSEKHRLWITVKALWFRFYIEIRQVTLKQ